VPTIEERLAEAKKKRDAKRQHSQIPGAASESTAVVGVDVSQAFTETSAQRGGSVAGAEELGAAPAAYDIVAEDESDTPILDEGLQDGSEVPSKVESGEDRAALLRMPRVEGSLNGPDSDEESDESGAYESLEGPHQLREDSEFGGQAATSPPQESGEYANPFSRPSITSSRDSYPFVYETVERPPVSRNRSSGETMATNAFDEAADQQVSDVAVKEADAEAAAKREAEDAEAAEAAEVERATLEAAAIRDAEAAEAAEVERATLEAAAIRDAKKAADKRASEEAAAKRAAEEFEAAQRADAARMEILRAAEKKVAIQEAAAKKAAAEEAATKRVASEEAAAADAAAVAEEQRHREQWAEKEASSAIAADRRRQADEDEWRVAEQARQAMVDAASETRRVARNPIPSSAPAASAHPPDAGVLDSTYENVTWPTSPPRQDSTTPRRDRSVEHLSLGPSTLDTSDPDLSRSLQEPTR
jgi:hypothetical protein